MDGDIWGTLGMLARPWSSSRLSCGECLLLRCDGKAGKGQSTCELLGSLSRCLSLCSAVLDLDWPFLRPPERVPEVPVVSREHLPQLEKIRDVLPSRQNEAYFR